eukprot:Plantae.Rhodophyta-Palmaria_palmata.ctg6638.p2 GENE.Plantae.Rhodophyta-Palmaria_palmata.ctg6638~~Plantae.Rhodophyta-Palmaria_palmata.ctg6638.p2  ORF type:complete len:136 (-),score=47.43 Plantae.Rhodophyta-Palmaria_palmata.ctg6638:292-699(-)
MLSEKQKDLVTRKINDEVDIPIMNERHEAKLIDKFVDKINDHLEPALRACMPDVYLVSLKIALDENKSKKVRQLEIRDLMRAEFSEPLSSELNARVDMSLIPEEAEGKVLKVVADEIVEQFVKIVIGEIDEALEG